ncbi:MAG TPA: formate dehydrogenase subunit delta [Steroidobacteraceae bacterium]|nr:formate dehydrogenase subunit delta [Steroidobacteraceae bacterium]
MKIESLIKMANEISYFYEAESGQDAPAAVATHLRRFWEPRMRKQMLEHYDRTGGEGLEEVARKAVALLAAERPSSAQQPPAARG